MTLSLIEEMKSYVGFGAADAAHLSELAGIVADGLPGVVEQFYKTILRHEHARRALEGGPAQLERLKGHLREWMQTLFCGEYGDAYVRRRAPIGEIHVRIGLPQHYMITAMEVIRREFARIIRRARLADEADKVAALDKLLALELGLMLDSYKASYSEGLREFERNAAKEQLSRVEHLAEVGRLAASLAHEVKNPLAGISGAIQIIRDETPADDPRQPVLVEVLRQINRLDGTMKDLLTYARPRPPGFHPIEIKHVVSHVAALLAQEPAFQHVRLDARDCDDLAVDADEHQLEQLLTNLLLNAAHASSPGDVVHLRVFAEDGEVLLVVEDAGAGMSEAVQRRAFEPFFTTKARGTGLGLPICRSIVDAHGGTISVRARDAGTTVEVRLPRRQIQREGGQKS